MQSRLSDPETIKFRSDLGFNQINSIPRKEQTVLKSIKDAFKGEDMQTQYTVIGQKIDLYFHKYKLVIEVDELRHVDRSLNNEIERQKASERELNCVFIRINPDEKAFNIFKEINKIYRHITQSNEENKTKEQKNKIKEKEEKIKDQENKIKEQEDKIKKQKNKFAKKLSSYASRISMPIKPIKFLLKKYFPHCKYEKYTNKNKTDKNWKTTWSNILFRV